MSVSIDNITKKVILNKLRLRCNYCYACYAEDVYVGVIERYFTHKSFFIFDGKNNKKRNKLMTNSSLIFSSRATHNNSNESIYETVRIKKTVPTVANYGKVIQIEFFCDKCYSTRFYEIDLEKITGKNHWV